MALKLFTTSKKPVRYNKYYNRLEIPISLEIGQKILDMQSKSIYGLSIEFKGRKRSNNANAMAWGLINKISRHQGLTNDEVYLQMLVDYGVIDETCAVWAETAHIIESQCKHIKKFDETIIDGHKFYWYHSYKGSSEYDTKQMSDFIDGILYEAKNLGIDTRSPAEIQLLKDDWKKHQTKAKNRV